MDVFTIGHSNHTIEAFIALLQQHGITAIADVRSHPYSRYLPHFNQGALKEALESHNIRYVFLGQELGARPNNRDCYLKGKAVYEKIAATDTFKQGIQRVLKGAKQYQVALMCAEKDPLTCHRAILVCQHLRQHPLTINHILKTGELEPHQHLEDRLLNKHGFSQVTGNHTYTQLSLFESDSNQPTREECLEKAYHLQGDEIAYIETKDSHHGQ